MFRPLSIIVILVCCVVVLVAPLPISARFYGTIAPRISSYSSSSASTVSRPSARLLRNTLERAASSRSVRRALGCRQSGPCPLPSSSSQSSSLSTSVRSSFSSAVHDPLPDSSAESHMLLLGEVSPVLARVQVLSRLEPMMIDRITIELTSSVDSVASFSIYRNDGTFLASASLDTDRTFVARLPASVLTLEKGEIAVLYVRATLRTFNDGGVSGETVQLARLTVAGNGLWSNDGAAFSATEGFLPSITARGIIQSIASLDTGKRRGLSNAIPLDLARLRVEPRSMDPSAITTLEHLSFSIDQASNVTLTNLTIRREDSPFFWNCDILRTTAACDIPPEEGRLFAPTVFTVRGTVTITGSQTPAYIQLNLQPRNSGALVWSDSTTTFTRMIDGPSDVWGPEWER